MPQFYPIENALASVFSRFPSMPPVGATAGRWTFVGGVCTRIAGTAAVAHIECECLCGQRRVIRLQGFLRGDSKSCGCLAREARREANTRHGMHDTKEYHAFESMKERCNVPTHKYYSFYGGRGIRVLYPDFPAFLADVGMSPSKDMTLDRKDNSRGYEPGNCRWVSREVQQNNTRRNRLITYQGRTLTLAQWGRELNVPAADLRGKITRTSVEEAFRSILTRHDKEPNRTARP